MLATFVTGIKYILYILLFLIVVVFITIRFPTQSTDSERKKQVILQTLIGQRSEKSIYAFKERTLIC